MNRKQLIDVHDNKKGMFNTRNGLLVDLNNPTAEMICDEDIAHALSNVCRFGGHTLGHYSVAQHSLLVASLAPKNLKLEALLHDATEAYLGDVIKPLKNIIGAVYMDLEKAFEVIISSKYDLEPANLKAIKYFDKLALGVEHSAYIDDDLSAFNFIHEKIVNEIGRDFQKFEIPMIFINQLKKYQNARKSNRVLSS